MEGHRLGVRMHPPKLGEHSRDLLRSVGYEADEIDRLYARNAVA